MDKVCQFYVILGNKDYQGKNDGNVYINATGVGDINLIKDAIFKYYHKKSKENVKVSSRIIFLIPDSSLDAQCQMIIDQLHLVGEIQYLPKRVEKVVPLESNALNSSTVFSSKEKVEDATSSIPGENGTVSHMVDSVNSIPQNTLEEVRQELEENSLEKEDKDKYSSVPLKDNIYRGDVDNSILSKKKDNQNGVSEMYAKDSATYMGYNPTLINNNVQSIVGNHRKSAFISLPVIVFILSAVLLIASIVILFVLD